MAEVIKRNDSKEAFDPEKTKKALKKAFEEAGLSLEENIEKIDDLVKEVREVSEEKGEIHSERIREMLLSRLDEIEPKAAEAWRNHDKEKKGIE